MPLPPQNKPYVFQTRTERKISSLIDNDAELTQADLNAVYCEAQIEYGIEKYRQSAEKMTMNDLVSEQHDSKKLAEHMASVGDPRPHSLAEAHAIIAGRHPGAATLRLIMAKMKRRIDDPTNGCWLPKNSAAIPQMPARLKKAVSHRRIHREKYYFWLNQSITLASIKDAKSLDNKLNEVAFRLQTSSFPPWVMLPKHAEIPE